MTRLRYLAAAIGCFLCFVTLASAQQLSTWQMALNALGRVHRAAEGPLEGAKRADDIVSVADVVSGYEKVRGVTNTLSTRTADERAEAADTAVQAGSIASGFGTVVTSLGVGSLFENMRSTTTTYTYLGASTDDLTRMTANSNNIDTAAVLSAEGNQFQRTADPGAYANSFKKPQAVPDSRSPIVQDAIDGISGYVERNVFEAAASFAQTLTSSPASSKTDRAVANVEPAVGGSSQTQGVVASEAPEPAPDDGTWRGKWIGTEDDPAENDCFAVSETNWPQEIMTNMMRDTIGQSQSPQCKISPLRQMAVDAFQMSITCACPHCVDYTTPNPAGGGTKRVVTAKVYKSGPPELINFLMGSDGNMGDKLSYRRCTPGDISARKPGSTAAQQTSTRDRE
jgi:hypothetical protein